MKVLEQASQGPTWKTVWSAGQSVGLVNDILSCQEIIDLFVQDYKRTIAQLPKVND